MVATLTGIPKQKMKNPPLKVHTLGDKVLRQPAKRVSSINEEIRKLATEMLQTMYSNDGIGLAAPQVGVHKQLIVVDCQLDKQEEPPLVLINPEIVEHEGALTLGEEGCLSVPLVFMDVMRPEKVIVSFRDLEGKPQRMAATGLVARVIQHEIDHLNGVMFVDRVQNTLVLNQRLTKQGFSPKDVRPFRS